MSMYSSGPHADHVFPSSARSADLDGSETRMVECCHPVSFAKNILGSSLMSQRRSSGFYAKRLAQSVKTNETDTRVDFKSMEQGALLEKALKDVKAIEKKFEQKKEILGTFQTVVRELISFVVRSPFRQDLASIEARLDAMQRDILCQLALGNIPLTYRNETLFKQIISDLKTELSDKYKQQLSKFSAQMQEKFRDCAEGYATTSDDGEPRSVEDLTFGPRSSDTGTLPLDLPNHIEETPRTLTERLNLPNRIDDSGVWGGREED